MTLQTTHIYQMVIVHVVLIWVVMLMLVKRLVVVKFQDIHVLEMVNGMLLQLTNMMLVYLIIYFLLAELNKQAVTIVLIQIGIGLETLIH